MLILLLIVTGGCQTPRVAPSDSPNYRLPTHSTVTLNRAVTIPGGRVKVFFQDGQLVHSPDQYEPFCRFDVWELKETPRTVNPGIFDVKRVRREWGLFVISGMGSRPLAYVGLPWISPFGDIPSPEVFGTILELYSPDQPDVYQLTCGHLQEPVLGARHLTLNEMRQALGKYFDISVGG